MFRTILSRLYILFHFIIRTIYVFVLTVVLALGFLWLNFFGREKRPKLLKWYLQTCGSAFIKLGQLMAMRYDLFPEEYCDELSKLLDEIPGLPAEKIIPIIENDLFAPLSSYFKDFNPTPLGTASIAQVHEARLNSGEEIVIKVLRPNNRVKFQIDLAYLKLMGRLIGQLGLLKNIDIKRLVREFVTLTWEEFDFKREARNIQEMHEAMLEDDVDHYAPKIYPELCGPSIITMEKISGVSVKTMIAAIQDNNIEQLNEWAGQGITPKRTARILIRSVLEQCMRHRLFHADPHAANLIVMKDGTLGWIDFGMLGWLDEHLLILQFKLRIAIQEERIHEAYTLLLETLEPVPPIDLTVFEADVKDSIRDWIAASRNPRASVVEKSSGYFFLRLFVAIRRAGLSMPPGLTRMYRSIIISDIVMLKLDPKIDWMPVLGEFLRDEQMRQAKVIIRETFTPSNLSSVLQFYANLPRTAVAVSDWMRDGLKEYGRSYRQQLSRLERISLLLMQYLRTVVVLFLLLTLSVKFFGLSWTQSLEKFNIFITTNWALITVLGTLIVLFLNKVISEFKRSGY